MEEAKKRLFANVIQRQPRPCQIRHPARIATERAVHTTTISIKNWRRTKVPVLEGDSDACGAQKLYLHFRPFDESRVELIVPTHRMTDAI